MSDLVYKENPPKLLKIIHSRKKFQISNIYFAYFEMVSNTFINSNQCWGYHHHLDNQYLLCTQNYSVNHSLTKLYHLCWYILIIINIKSNYYSQEITLTPK